MQLYSWCLPFHKFLLPFSEFCQAEIIYLGIGPRTVQSLRGQGSSIIIPYRNKRVSGNWGAQKCQLAASVSFSTRQTSGCTQLEVLISVLEKKQHIHQSLSCFHTPSTHASTATRSWT